MKWYFFISAVLFSYSVNADVYYIDAISSTESESILLGEVSKALANGYVNAGHSVTADRSTADWFVEPTLIADKKGYTLSLTKSSDKAAVYRSSLKAKNKKDLPNVAEELVQRSLLFNQGNLDKLASSDPNKDILYRYGKKTKSSFYAGLGYGGGDGIDAEDNQGVSWNLGYLHMLNRFIGAKFNVEGVALSSSDGNMGSVTTGFQFYPLKRRHSPYLSTLIGYAWTESGSLATDDCTVLCDRLNNIKESGFGANLALGYHFFRNKPLHFGVELYYTRAFYKVNEQAPESYGGRIILYWK